MATNNAINLQGPTPAFYVNLGLDYSDATGDSTLFTLPYGDVMYDTTSSYSTLTNEFTAPLDGVYLFTSSIYMAGITSSHTLGHFYITVNSDAYVAWEGNPYALSSTATIFSYNSSLMLDLVTGDTVKTQTQVDNGTKVIDFYGSAGLNWFSGVYIPFV